jgi:hypothetical protein
VKAARILIRLAYDHFAAAASLMLSQHLAAQRVAGGAPGQRAVWSKADETGPGIADAAPRGFPAIRQFTVRAVSCDMTVAFAFKALHGATSGFRIFRPYFSYRQSQHLAI